jgi:integrase
MRIGKRVLDDLAKRWERDAGNGGPALREVLWDEALPGFGIRRQADRSISYIVKLRVKGTKLQRLVTLGSWPAVHPDAAREEARRHREAAALGRDLVAERRVEAERAAAAAAEARRQGILVTEVLDAWRAALAAEVAVLQGQGRPATHQRELLRLEAKHLRPAVVGQTVAGFDPESLQGVLDRASGHSAAVNLRTLFSRVARFARVWLAERGLRVNWQRAYEVDHARPPARAQRYSVDEAARLWLAAGKLGRRGALVRIMLLTGCRRSEAVRLRLDHLRLDDAVLGAHVEIEAAQVKHRRNTRLPLVPAAEALLRWLPVRESRRAGAGALVFAGRGNKPVGGWSLVLRALLVEAGLQAGWLHDIRRTVVSTLADHGWDPTVVDRVLNHASSSTMTGVMAVYQRSDQWAQQRAALDAWAALLLGAAGRIRGAPIEAPAWGLDQPFTDAVVRRV